MNRVLLATLAFYRRWLSPTLHALTPGQGCRYVPTCSEYATIAISTHGSLRGSALAIWRVLRCNPFGRGGLDNVPPKLPPRASRATQQQPVAPHEPLP